jgi:hypothetical protein
VDSQELVPGGYSIGSGERFGSGVLGASRTLAKSDVDRDILSLAIEKSRDKVDEHFERVKNTRKNRPEYSSAMINSHSSFRVNTSSCSS